MKIKYKGEQDRKTESIRSILYFMQFIENKIIKEQVASLSNQDLEGINGFSKFMALRLK